MLLRAAGKEDTGPNRMRKEGENDVEVVIYDVKLANLETETNWN